jgi:hypothetical protein
MKITETILVDISSVATLFGIPILKNLEAKAAQLLCGEINICPALKQTDGTDWRGKEGAQRLAKWVSGNKAAFSKGSRLFAVEQIKRDCQLE